MPSTVRRRALDAWKDAGLERLTLHEDRHTTGTDGGFAGLDDKSLAHLMGHSSVVITKDRYGHMTDQAIRDATATMNAYYRRAASAPVGGG